ncbi:MAG: glycosyltransferase family 9 protein [Dehalococcoidia bacterium]|nr:glycosyltransferase family 9 protein [Dehalococcoidia bacterium]
MSNRPVFQSSVSLVGRPGAAAHAASRYRLTQRNKRRVLRWVEPMLKVAFALFRLATGEWRRDHTLSSLDPDRLRILVVRLDTIGDVLLSEPAIAAVRAKYPKAVIDVVTSPAGAAVLAGNPAIDSVVVYRAPWHAVWRGGRIGWRDARDLVAIARRLRANRYDLGIELRADVRDIAFLALMGARVTVGDSWRGGEWLLNVDAHAPIEAHRVDFALAIAAAAGANPTPRAPRLYLSESDWAVARQQLAPLEGRPFIAMHLGAGFASKCLPVDRFVKVANKLGRDHAIVLVGGGEERPLADAFLQGTTARTLDLVGRLTLGQTAAALAHADLFIGNDSGPMHLAAAMGRPIVTFFGPSEPHKYHPYGAPLRLLEIDLPCRPCDHVHCVHDEYLCMTRIPASSIVEAAQDLLAASAARVG